MVELFLQAGSVINLSDNMFINNRGVAESYNSAITIITSIYYFEIILLQGGVLRSISCTITIKASEFDSNSATEFGGVLKFNVVFSNDLENLTLYAANGPCKVAKLSTKIIQIHFLPCSCPIGLQ